MSIVANETHEHGRMKLLQYGTGCAAECSEVTESTIPYLLNRMLLYISNERKDRVTYPQVFDRPQPILCSRVQTKLIGHDLCCGQLWV